MLKRSIRRGIVARILAIASGLFLFLILLELGLRLAGFGFLSLQERRNRLLARQKGRYTIMCVGESTTAVGGAYSYPSQLQEILNQRRIGVRFSVINKGVPGIHTSEILNRFGSDLDAYHPDMVISMMGSGDSGPHMPYEVVVPKAMNFFRSFKVYKLALSLGSRIAKGLKAAIPGKPGKNTAQQAAPGKADRRKSGTYPGRGWAYERQGRYPDAEAAFKEAIEADPGNALAYLQLGWFYRAQGKFTEAEGLFKKAIKLHTGNGRPYSGQGGFAEAQAVFKNSIELNPDDYWSYIGLGWIALEEARYSQAEDLFRKAVAVNPANDWPYVEMGQFYLEQGKSSQAEAAFRKAIELDPRNDRPYIRLGWISREQGRDPEAEELFRKAIEVNPGNDWPYVEIGRFYQEQNRISEADTAFRKAVALNPDNDWAYVGLGRLLQAQGKIPAAVAAFNKALELNPQNDRACRTLRVLYMEMGNHSLAGRYGRKADEIRSGYYPPVIIDDYQRLKAALDKRGITYVCAQYPMRSLEPLKKIFRGEQGIVFVDNEKLFKEAVQKGGYQEYFVDTCNGDFGHCTPKGNRLLAENIANAILDRVFSVKGGIDAAQTRERP